MARPHGKYIVDSDRVLHHTKYYLEISDEEIDLVIDKNNGDSLCQQCMIRVICEI